ncbi:hypothetical protein ABZ915_35510 [Streptomyces sp. NPDC046915]|uniref:hypothetical protein n=1 Tax=Streptomyces sp. NPDC046915 TaxID=3155257 RepID=UPI00340D2C39
MRDLGRGEEPAGTGVTRRPETGSGAFTAGADGGSGDTTGTSGPATVAGRPDAGGTEPPAFARWTEGACPPVRTAPPAGADADVVVGPPGTTGPLGAAARAGEADPPAVPAVPTASGPRGGSSRSGTAGARCTTGCPGGPANGRAPAGFSRPDTGRAADERNVSPSIALDRPSSTAWDAAPMKDGFCHVGSRPPNRASATPAGLGAMARWIGGSPGQEGATTGRPPARTSPLAGAGPTAASAAVAPLSADAPPSAGVPLRNRSRKPTAQPSAPARVTRDAIWSV